MLQNASLIKGLYNQTQGNFNQSPFSWPWACLPKEASLPKKRNYKKVIATVTSPNTKAKEGAVETWVDMSSLV